MKLLLREFVASLREREELDAILPDLLSELGYTVISRPGRGTRQHGVDIAAVGKDDDGIRKLFLFSVKQGDLTRQGWDNGTPQALRPSLNEILDAYIPKRIPMRYRNLPIVICVCIGGDIHEQVADDVRGYIERNTRPDLTFDEWNGDRIAGFILAGVLREEILPSSLRSSFQKAVAMADEPDVAYAHFSDLLAKLHRQAKSLGERVTAARQIYVCLWILFVWARDVENLEAPCKCSELSLLTVWDLLRPTIGKRHKGSRALARALNQIIQLHLLITGTFMEQKILPHVAKRHAISLAVQSRNALDVNLRLFDLLGRVAMFGLWIGWLHGKAPETPEPWKLKINELLSAAFRLISQNPALFSPISDQQAIDIALVLQLALQKGEVPEAISTWVGEMTDRIDFSIRTHGKYPCIYTEYGDLIEHPKEQTDEYLKEATSGSILIPLLACWLIAFDDREKLTKLEELVRTKLEHCTLQQWLPEKSSEESIYRGGMDHGIALLDLRVVAAEFQPVMEIAEACRRERAFDELSAIRTGYWPVLLLACRHHRLPVPPHFWIAALERSVKHSDDVTRSVSSAQA